MDSKLVRAYLIELVGVFLLVYVSAGVVCVNVAATPANQDHGVRPLTTHQSGLLGIALAHGLTFGVLVALTAPVSGGYLNPAITLLLWVSNRLDTRRGAWLIGAQLVGSVLAGLCLRSTFDPRILDDAHYGAPHLNLLAFPNLGRPSQLAGTATELVLTFFLTFAIFGLFAGATRARLGGLAAGAVVTAGVLAAFPLTGAAFNPARWFGPVFWEYVDSSAGIGRSPWNDALVFLAGPIVGALLGGLFCFWLYLPALEEKTEPAREPAAKSTATEKAKKR